MQSLAEGPRTFLHGDLRLDNIFFGSTDRVEAADAHRLADFGSRPGPPDIACLLSQSIDVDARRAHEHEWLKGYHGAVSRKDTGYSWEECWADYRAATLLCAVYPIIAGGRPRQRARRNWYGRWRGGVRDYGPDADEAAFQLRGAWRAAVAGVTLTFWPPLPR
ncbi:MAG: hypothetical protein R3B97_11795 [Dehalococcoidia bacterium]